MPLDVSASPAHFYQCPSSVFQEEEAILNRTCLTGSCQMWRKMICPHDGLLMVSRNQQCLLTSTSRTKATRPPTSQRLWERRRRSGRSTGRAGARPPPPWVGKGPSGRSEVSVLWCTITKGCKWPVHPRELVIKCRFIEVPRIMPGAQ